MYTTIIVLPFIVLFFAFILAWMTTSIFEIKKYKYYLTGIFFLIIITLFATLIWMRQGGNEVIHFFYVVSAHFLGAFWLSFLIILPVYTARKIMKKEFSHQIKIVIALAIVAINIFGLYNGYKTTIREIIIDSEKNSSLTGKNIILISDTHYGAMFNVNSAKKLVKNINSIQAEFVMIAGDLFDGPDTNFEEIGKILSGINKPVYYAIGNHEEYGNTQRMLESVNFENFSILMNEKISPYSDVNIVGVTYHENFYENNFKKILENIETDLHSFKILIKHSPTHLEHAKNLGYDLVVSGHTHRGQMWPFSLITDYMYGSHSHGLTVKDSTFFYTSVGVGGWGPPQRLGSQSEIIVLKIQ